MAAERLVAAAEAGAHIALTGGSTPRAAYERAAGMDADWSRATLWFGDERCVPPEHEHSNFRMAHEALIGRLPEPRDGGPTVHRMEGERGPDDGAVHYEAELRAVFGDARPRLDLLLLGLGADAHCASLFPNHPALSESDRLVVGVATPGLEPIVPRITLTLPVLNAALEVLFLVGGEGKAEAVARVFGGEGPGEDAPASLVVPSDGSLTVLLDPPAAGRLGAG